MKLRTFYYTFGILSAIVLYTYGTTLGKAVDRWMNDVQYSHGWFVPIFAVFLLYHRREMLDEDKLQPSWWGLLFLLPALGLRWWGVYYYYDSFDAASLVPILMGLVIVLGGWTAFRWAWPSLMFLLFMVPPPYFLHIAMSTQLQGVATAMSTFVLQTFGLPAVQEGTIIRINESRINVAEACSGLGMIVTFVALSVAAVLLISSRWWVKAGLLLGAIPVSLFCNMVRISVVGVFKYWEYDFKTVEMIHEVMGWVMIILGCGLIFVELYVLDRIVVAPVSTRDNDTPLPLPYGTRA